jgi:hypothetical protein
MRRSALFDVLCRLGRASTRFLLMGRGTTPQRALMWLGWRPLASLTLYQVSLVAWVTIVAPERPPPTRICRFRRLRRCLRRRCSTRKYNSYSWSSSAHALSIRQNETRLEHSLLLLKQHRNVLRRRPRV